MLGIATHEPHFRVLREDVFANDTKPGHCRKCNQPGHMAAECRGTTRAKPSEQAVEKPLKPFIWLHVSILREYLAVEMNVPRQPFPFNLERALDDWVFMCFFVGNDFLPHLPSLDIREDGIDTLIAIWRDNIPAMGGYITRDGNVQLSRVQTILQGLANQEAAIFKRRREGELRKDAASKRRAEQQDRRASAKRMRLSDRANFGIDETVVRRGPRGGIISPDAAPDINTLPTFAPGVAGTKDDPRYAKPPSMLTHADVVGGTSANAGNRSAAAALKEQLMKGNEPRDRQTLPGGSTLPVSSSPAHHSVSQPAVHGKRTRDALDDGDGNAAASEHPTPVSNTLSATSTGEGTSRALGGNSGGEDSVPEDTVKLWEEGYQSRYYEQKFRVDANDIEFRHKVARAYVEGLCWVLRYYFQGCPSWTWYYPYHYAPFAQDFNHLESMEVHFQEGKPFRPYEQLMGVMPAASRHTIPEVFHPLMTDDDSPIKEFYPNDFEVDLNGKKFAWQGVALLPFIDERRLLEAMGTKYQLLNADEKRRNAFGEECLIFSTSNNLYEGVASAFYGKKNGVAKLKLNAKTSNGLAGRVSKSQTFVPNSALEFPFKAGNQSDFASLDQDESVSVNYHMPSVNGDHKSMLLPGVAFEKPVLDYSDVRITHDRANKSGRSHGGVQLSQNGDRSDGRRVDYGARPDQQGLSYPNSNSYQGTDGGSYGQGFAAQASEAFASLPSHLAQQAAAHGFPPPGQFARGPPAFPMQHPPAFAQMPMPYVPQEQNQGRDSRNMNYNRGSYGGYEGRNGRYTGNFDGGQGTRGYGSRSYGDRRGY